jgi:RNA polymerase sigma-70 factor, ECF subfamily
LRVGGGPVYPFGLMEPGPRQDIEAEIRRLAQAGDHEGAATIALRSYGPEIYSFLAAAARGGDEADEVFSMFAEGLWRNLASFEWQSTFRTWAYAVARRTALRFRRDKQRRARRQEPLPESSASFRVAAEVRSATQAHLRTEVKSRIAELRDSLPEEDRELLLLRVDRDLSWLELAQVLHDDAEKPLEGAVLKREAARLRKRFQIVKDRLREMARKEGLLQEDDEASG